jgi:DNA-binding CsgD family transcriptional regulator
MSPFFSCTIDDRQVNLTRQQTRVFVYTIMGLTVPEIATRLNINVRTAEAHSDTVKEKFDVMQRNHLIALAWKHKLTYLIDLVN